jgi:WD40 repeat protein/tetratricopeptide (TPR) repeat protein
VGVDAGVPFIVSELIEGNSLAELMAGRRMDPRRAAELVLGVAEALAYAHGEGVTHRDVKPGNILVDREGRPHLSDFGLARLEDDDLATVTLEGQVLGTPAYMSPEQAAGRRRDVGATSDIYGLGVVLYELLTGERPFSGSRSAILDQVLRIEPRAPRSLARDIPADLETICLKAMAKEAGRRYPSAAELAADLKRFLAGESIHARPVSQLERAWLWSKRRPLVASLIAVVAALLVAVAVVSAVYGVRTRLAYDEARRRLSRLDVATGFRHVEDGDLLGALSWFAEAYRLDAGDPRRLEAHRLRINATLGRCPKLVRVWRFEGQVLNVALGPDGDVLATGSAAGFWLVGQTTGEKRRLGDLRPEDQRAFSSLGSYIEFSPDGTRVLTAHFDGVRVWPADPRGTGGPSIERKVRAFHATFSPDGRQIAVVGDMGSRVLVLDAADPGATGLEVPFDQAATHAAFSPDGRLVAAAGAGGIVLVFRSKTGDEVARLEHAAAVARVSFSPDGSLLLSASRDTTAGLWDVSTWRRLHSLKHSGEVPHAAFSQDGARVLTACLDGTTSLWDASTGERRLGPFKHILGVGHATLSLDGRFLADASFDGTAWVRDAETGDPIAPALYHGSAATRAIFSPDGRFLVTASCDGLVRVWDLAATEGGLAAPERYRAVFDMSPDAMGLLVAVATRTGVRVWDLEKCVPISPFLTHKTDIQRVALSPRGDLVATASEGEAALWEARTGKQRSKWKHDAAIDSVAFSPAGDLVVTAGRDRKALVVDARRGEMRFAVREHGAEVSHATFSPDGSLLATASSRDGTARLWDTRTGEARLAPLRSASVGLSGVSMSCFSPDGRRLATAGIDETARVFDTASGEEVVPPMRHKANVVWVAFDGGGNRLATASDDGTARIWNALTGQPLTPPLRHAGAVGRAVFSRGDRFLLTSAVQGTARLWDAETGEQVTPEFGRRVRGIFFSGSDRVVIGGAEGMEVWPLERTERSPADISAVARLLSGREIDSTEGLVRLDHDAFRGEFMASWKRLGSASSPDLETSLEEAARWHERAVSFFRRNRDWRGVVLHADRLLGELRSTPDLHALRGRAHAELGAWSRAAQDYETAIALGHDEFWTWYGLTTAHLAAGAVDDYRRLCARLLERDGKPGASMLLPNHFAWLFVLAPAAVEDWEPVLRRAREAVLDDSADAHHTLGTVLYRSGRIEEALEEVTVAAEKRGEEPLVWEQVILAMVNARLGRRDEAAGFLEKASRWHEANAGTWSCHARVALRVLLDEARSAVEAAGGP